MKHKLLLVTVVLFGLHRLDAQQSRSITLKEATDLTLSYSKTLKANKSKIEDAAAAVQEANDKKLPDANIGGTYMYFPIQPNLSLKSGSGSPTGGAKVNQFMYGSANVSVPLFSAGKLNYGIESAKYLEQAVKLDADNDRDLVILNVTYGCINLYKAYQAIALVKENLEQSQQRVKDLTSLEKNGLLARNDLMRAELQNSSVELSLLDAESNYKIACINMNLMMGLPEQTVLIPDKAGLALPTSVGTLEEYEQAALQNRKDLTALSFRKKAADVGIKTAKTGYYPSVTLTSGYIAADVPGFLTITNAISVGAGIKYDLSSLWKIKTSIQRATIKEQEIKINEEALNDNIRMQINQAYQTYLVSLKKIEVYEKSVEQATENYRITKNKFDNSLATTTELLDADVALFQTKLSVINSKADSFLAYKKILQVSGTLNQ